MTEQEYIQELYEHLKETFREEYSIAVGWSQDDKHYVRICPLNEFDHIIFVKIVMRNHIRFLSIKQSNQQFARLKIIHQHLE